MLTLQPTLRLGRDAWNRDAMPVDEFQGRVARLRAAMAPLDLQALLLYGRGLNHCGHPTYVSNYIVKLPFAALVVLPREGEPVLMFEGATRGRAAAGATTWIEDVRPCWNLAGECLLVLKERDLLHGRIGLAGLPRLMPFADWRVLTGGLEVATLVDVESQVDALRMIKSPRELAQIERATHLVHTTLARVPTMERAPDETALAAAVIREARRLGAEDIRIALGRHEEGRWVFAPPQHGPIASGDRLAITVAASWERYWSQATRTFDVRAEGLANAWNAETETGFCDITSRSRPGGLIADLTTARAAGITSIEGHGIGITPEEPPALTSTMRLESGMVLVVSASFEAVGGPVMFGETLTV